MLDVALDEFDRGIFAASDRDQFGADVEPDAVIAFAREQRGERAGAAAEIGDPRAGLEPAQFDERVDQAGARLRRKDIVVVGRRMTVEERDFFLLVLLQAQSTCTDQSTLR